MIREAEGDGSSCRRLLDLLAGWMMYVDGCIDAATDAAEKAVYEREAEMIHALYQDLGSRSGDCAELDRQAYEFLQDKITNLIILGAGPDSPDRSPDRG
jgi:hypothetical protein